MLSVVDSSQSRAGAERVATLRQIDGSTAAVLDTVLNTPTVKHCFRVCRPCCRLLATQISPSFTHKSSFPTTMLSTWYSTGLIVDQVQQGTCESAPFQGPRASHTLLSGRMTQVLRA